MKKQMLLIVVLLLAITGCKDSPKSQVTTDTLETSTVGGVALAHRSDITPPVEFTAINALYRVLYPATIMSRPDFGGKVIRQLKAGQSYIVLGQVEHFWMALADVGKPELIGYVPMRAVVKSELYGQTVRTQPQYRKTRGKSTCVNVDINAKACKDRGSDTWILD